MITLSPDQVTVLMDTDNTRLPSETVQFLVPLKDASMYCRKTNLHAVKSKGSESTFSLGLCSHPLLTKIAPDSLNL